MSRVMHKSFRVGVLGATGVVGREMIKVLEERGFPLAKLVPLASKRSVGEKILVKGETLAVQEAKEDSFKDLDIVLMSAGASVSAKFAPLAQEYGAIVIDNSSYWRMHEDVPLVVPEVNAEDIGQYKKTHIIANPNCSTIQMVVALNPLHRRASLKRVIVSTYQAVSGKGKAAIDELSAQVQDLFKGGEVVPQVFPKRIAFNCLPHIDVFMSDGFTKEEHKMMQETRKIMHLPDVQVCATCVRVPVFNGHAESVVAEFAQPLSVDEARQLLKEAPGVLMYPLTAEEEAENGEAAPNYASQTMLKPEDDYPTPMDVEGTDATYVGRLRQDPSAPHSLAFWCVADNLRKGAASNAVQIAEILARDYL